MTTGNIMNSYGKRTVKKAAQPRRCAMQLPSLSALIALAIGLASCSQEQAGYLLQSVTPTVTLMRVLWKNHEVKELSEVIIAALTVNNKLDSFGRQR
jgi:hypothetical protein